MRSRLAAQDGSAMVTAILVTLLVLTVGFTTLATVDPQQGAARKQREREATFQLSEGVLNAQVFQLSRRWPADSTSAYPLSCTQASTSPDCPAQSSMTASYAGIDYGQVAWTTTMRDNGTGTGNFYNPAVADTQPRWDANGDGLMWVRADSRLVDPANAARFTPRALVALVRVEKVPLYLPQAGLITDHFAITNNGQKTIIDTNGLSNQLLPADIIVRCDAVGFTSSTLCAQYNKTTTPRQIEPDTVTYRPASIPPALSPEKLELLRSRAKADGNYFATGCAPTPAGDKPGEVVFMEAPTACHYSANNVWNSATQPGMLVMASGTLLLDGSSVFHGVIYHANLINSPLTLVKITGSAQVIGSIQVAGQGGVDVGSNAEPNLVFEPSYLDQIASYGTASIVQNSFRELPVSG